MNELEKIEVQEKLDIVYIPIEEIKPNNYNPNEMSEEKYIELVNEVKVLRKIPKPIVVREREDYYEIIDGEHNLKAAKENGLIELPCEIINVDDFEAMRQTYKRNQHGIHDQYKQGLMFEKMLKEKGLNKSQLAKEIDISEGTIRNSLLYVDISKRYKEELIEEDGKMYFKNIELRSRDGYFALSLSRLSIRQIRLLIILPVKIGIMWLQDGANESYLKNCFNDSLIWNIYNYEEPEELSIKEKFENLEKTGLIDLLFKKHGIRGLKDGLKILNKWMDWESKWTWGGITKEELRKYTKHYFIGKWLFPELHYMDYTLRLLINTHHAERSKKAEFKLSPEEFEEVVNNQGYENSRDYEEFLKLTITQKTGEKIEDIDRYWSKDQLLEKELVMAPDYIKNCNLRPREKYALWKIEIKYEPAELVLQAKKEIASTLEIAYIEKDKELKEIIEKHIQRLINEEKLKHRFDGMSKEDIALEIAVNLQLYDPKKHMIFIKGMVNILKNLNEHELKIIAEKVRGYQYRKEYIDKMKNLFGITQYE